MDDIREIKRELTDLIEKARTEKLWIYYSSQDMWLSPSSLEKLNAAGRYLWGAVNWQLRNPREQIDEINKRIENFKDRIVDIETEIASEQQ